MSFQGVCCKRSIQSFFLHGRTCCGEHGTPDPSDPSDKELCATGLAMGNSICRDLYRTPNIYMYILYINHSDSNPIALNIIELLNYSWVNYGKSNFLFFYHQWTTGMTSSDVTGPLSGTQVCDVGWTSSAVLVGDWGMGMWWTHWPLKMNRSKTKTWVLWRYLVDFILFCY